MQSEQEIEEIKSNEDKNIKKLRELFEKRQSQNENHPKTSHGYKSSINHNSTNINSKTCKKSPLRYNKALSANKYNHKIYKNTNKLNEKISYNFCKKNPGYLYYKEVITNLKNNRLNKIRTLTGKIINRKMKLEPAFKNFKKGSNNKYNKNQKFPKINSSYNNKSNGKQKLYNFNYNNNQDKNNPYYYFWVNKILNQNNFKIGIKGMAYGVPQLGSVNKKEDFLVKVLHKPKEKGNYFDNSTKNSFKSYKNLSNGNRHYYNNFVGMTNQNNKKNERIAKGKFDENKNKNNDKCYIIKNDDKSNNMKKIFNENNDENNKEKILEDNNNENKENINNIIKENNENKEDEFEDESFDEEQQKQFYKNQKNFFKARKDIMEEPEYLEEDNDDKI